MKEFKLSDVCIFDTETTGVPKKGLKWDEDYKQFPQVVQLAWMINGVGKSYIIKPDGYEIPQETVDIHGITTERAIKDGVPFKMAVDEFLDDALTAPLVCAHNIYFDTSIIKANIMRYCGKDYYYEKAEDALFKGKRIDTMMKTIKFVGALRANGTPGKFPKLEELYAKLFNETYPAHDALEDVKALARCIPELVKIGIIKLVQKEYPPEQLQIKPESDTKVEFKDSEPVIMPGDIPEKKESENKTETSISKSIAKSKEMLGDDEF